MDANTSLKKFTKKVKGELADLRMIGDKPVGDGDIVSLAGVLLSEADLLDNLCQSEGITRELRLMTSEGVLTSSQLDRISEMVEKSGKVSVFSLYVRALSAFSAGDYGKTISIICSSDDLSHITDAIELLKISCFNVGDYVKASLFLARNGMYDDVIFGGLRKSSPSASTVEELFSSAHSVAFSEDVCRILEFVTDFDKGNDKLLALARCLAQMGNGEASGAVLKKINFEEYTTSQEFIDFIDVSLRAEEPAIAYRVAKFGKTMFPDDRKLLFLFAKCQQMLGKTSEAEENLVALIREEPENDEARELLSTIMFDRGDYSAYVDLLQPLRDRIFTRVPELLKYIRAEINSSRIDEAMQDIRTAESNFPDNLDILDLKLSLLILINDQNGAFEIAKQIFSLSRNNARARDYYLNSLYGRHEYEEFIKRLDEFGSDDGFEGKKAGALFYLGEVEQAVEYVHHHPAALSSGDFLDAILFTVRDRESLNKLSSLNEENGELLSVVLDFLRGIQVKWDEDLIRKVSDSGSSGLVWIFAHSTIDFRRRHKPAVVENVISKPQYNTVNILVDAVLLVYSGVISESMVDSRKFLYPLTEALINTGKYDEAEKMLNGSVDSRNPDSFSYYFGSQIDLGRGDIQSAERNIERAMELLDNARFLAQRIRVDIRRGDVEAVVENIRKIHALGQAQLIDYGSLYDLIRQRGNTSMRDRFLQLFEDLQIENIWTNRLLRDKNRSEENYDDARRVSRLIVVSRSKTPEDIKAHAEILKASKHMDERAEFLESVETELSDPVIDVWLGDTYFLKKEFKKSIEYYRKAIEKGIDAARMRNYPLALINVGDYSTAEEIIHRMPQKKVLLVTLYQRTQRIGDIIKLVRGITFSDPEDLQTVKKLADVLWVNRMVRDALIDLFNRTGNFEFGRVLIDKMIESRDLEGAERAMKTLLKEFPDDLRIIEKYANLLYETHRFIEAINMLSRGLKLVSDRNTAQRIIDFLFRIYYETADYENVIRLYAANQGYVNEKNIQWIIRSYIEEMDFETADRLIGYYHGKIIPNDVFNELIEEMGTKKEFLKIMGFAAEILDIEFRLNHVMRAEDIVAMTDIPLDTVDNVLKFIDSEDYYRPGDERYYEDMTRELFRNIVKKTTIQDIGDVKIYLIYHMLPGRDIILAKNIYVYIKRCLRKKRSLMVKDRRKNALLKKALRMRLPPKVLLLAGRLNLGMDEALDVLKLMEYVLRLNEVY